MCLWSSSLPTSCGSCSGSAYARLGKPFGLVLVVQSVVMVCVQVFLLGVCVQNKKREEKKGSQLIGDFWNWNEAATYCNLQPDYFLLLFWAALSTLTLALRSLPVYFELLGFAALLTEAVLGIPQLLKNLKSGSTEGLSVGMIYGWAVGDVCKTAYFVGKAEPVQFVVCGVVQIAVDLSILAQVFLYRKDTPAL